MLRPLFRTLGNCNFKNYNIKTFNKYGLKIKLIFFHIHIIKINIKKTKLAELSTWGVMVPGLHKWTNAHQTHESQKLGCCFKSTLC